MSTARFVTGVKFQWNSYEYEVTRLLHGRRIQITNTDTGEIQTVTFDELIAALFVKRTLKFLIIGKAARRTSDGASTVEYNYIDLDDCPDHLVNIARWRLWIIQPLLAIPEQERTRKDVEERFQEVKSQILHGRRTLITTISIPSMYRWMRLYRQGNEDLRALIPDTQKRGGKDQPRISCDLDATITKVIKDLWYRRERVTIDIIHQVVAAEL